MARIAQDLIYELAEQVNCPLDPLRESRLIALKLAERVLRAETQGNGPLSPPRCLPACDSPYYGNSHHPDCLRGAWEAEQHCSQGDDCRHEEVCPVCGKCKWHLGSCIAKNTQPKRIQELEGALRQALNQWRMYAEQDPDFESTVDPTLEGIEYRKCCDCLESR